MKICELYFKYTALYVLFFLLVGVAGFLTFICNQIIIIKRKVTEIYDIFKHIYIQLKIFVKKVFEVKQSSKKKLKNKSTQPINQKILPPRTRKRTQRFGIDYSVY